MPSSVPAMRGRTEWRSRHTLLAYCVFAYFAIRFVQVLIGPIVPVIVDTFAVRHGTIGIVLSGMWVTYAAVQLPSGVAGDWLGPRRIVIGALLVTGAMSLIAGVAPGIWVFAVALIVIGGSAGAYYNPATALLAREFNDIGGAIGIHRIGGQAAGVVAPLIAAATVASVGWRPTMLFGAVLALAVAPLFFLDRSRSPQARSRDERTSLPDMETLRALASRAHLQITTVMMTLAEFVGLAAMAFLPSLLVDHSGFSLRSANVLFAVFFAVSALAQPIGGWLSDRIGRDRTVAIQMAIGGCGFGLLATGTGGAIAIVAVIAGGVALSGTPVIQSRMLDGLSDSNQGTGFGLFRTGYLLVGATSAGIVGVTVDVAGWAVAFGGLTALLAIVLGIALWQGGSKPRIR